MKPAKKVEDGDIIDFGGVEAEVSEREEARRGLFSDSPDAMETSFRAWHWPLPPYIAGKRAPDEQDNDDYQTLFAREEGGSLRRPLVCTSRQNWSRL